MGKALAVQSGHALPPLEPPKPVVHPEPALTDSGYKTKRGHAVKPPSYLNDYV